MGAAVTAVTAETKHCQPVRAAYMPVVIGGKLAFRYDPRRHVVEWQAKGETHYIDLARLEEIARDIDKRPE